MNKNAEVTRITSSRHRGNLKIAKLSAPKPPALTERDLLGVHQLWQRSLDPHELLSRLQEEVARFVPFDSFSYQNSEANLSVICGNDQTHRCSYQLNLEKQPLGELAITRSKRFSEDEMYTLERLVGTWIYSFRNSINYQSAIRHAYTDTLTGLLNRNALENLFPKEIQSATRDRNELSVLLIDVDSFKQINDRFGHAIGDQVLRHVANVIVTTIRRSDMVFRQGGEEFAILLPGTDLEGAECVGDKIRRATESTIFDLQGLHIPITISVGATGMQSGDTTADLIDKADRAMYSAKAAGRNCLRTA
ncbi:GGDEF domain-containing protein [Porticoccaceae bacterium LTM1]|nr:GGDEF domain-containing protein [Porticoccaceae bacterium LTM1]